MAQFDIGSETYRSRRMSAMTEAHITRRLTPVINGMIPQVLANVARTGGGQIDLGATNTEQAAKLMSEFITFVSSMTDADANYIISECCIVTERKQGDSWAPVWARGGQGPQFSDIRFPTMALIVFHVVKEAVTDFMPALGLNSGAGGALSSLTPSTSPAN